MMWDHETANARMSVFEADGGSVVVVLTGSAGGGVSIRLDPPQVASLIQSLEAHQVSQEKMKISVEFEIEKEPTNEVEGDAWKPRPADVLGDLSGYLRRLGDDTGYRYVAVSVGGVTAHPAK